MNRILTAALVLTTIWALNAGAAGVRVEMARGEEPVAEVSADIFPQGATILFQGDSITDGGRGRGEDPNHILGHSYPFCVASALGGRFPESNWNFLNRGVSGDTLAELQTRWDAETVALKPDYLSILIGVNDVWRGKTPEEYRERYDALLAETKAKLPETKLIIIEPFALTDDADKTARMTEERKIARELAEKYGAIFVPTQGAFSAKAASEPAPKYWIWDGVHPTYRGHWLLAQLWLKAVADAK